MNLLNPTTSELLLFILVFVRTISILMLLPIFGATNVPMPLQIGLALMISILLLPFTKTMAPVAVPPSLLSFAVLVSKELVIGILIGFCASMLFAALQFAGALIDMQIGFGFVDVVDPFTEMPTTVLGQFNSLIFTMIFLSINGHYFLLLAIQKSFEMIPVLGVQVPGGELVAYMTGMVTNLFILGIKIAAPVFVTLVLTTVALGIVARTVPQLNVFFVGVPLSIVIGLGLSIYMLPTMAIYFKKLVQLMVGDIWRLLYLLA